MILVALVGVIVVGVVAIVAMCFRGRFRADLDHKHLTIKVDGEGRNDSE
jgi:hypothetical protein